MRRLWNDQGSRSTFLDEVIMSSEQNRQPVIRGECVGLRPVIQSDIAVLDSWTNDIAIQGSYNMFGLERMNGLLSGFQARGLLDDDQGTLMIVTLAGEIVGSMSYHEVRYGPNSATKATEQKRSGSWPSICFRPFLSHVSKQRPTLPTSPNSGLWRRPASCVKVCCGKPNGARAIGTTWWCTAECVATSDAGGVNCALLRTSDHRRQSEAIDVNQRARE
jgi:hypothetical protein